MQKNATYKSANLIMQNFITILSQDLRLNKPIFLLFKINTNYHMNRFI